MNDNKIHPEQTPQVAASNVVQIPVVVPEGAAPGATIQVPYNNMMYNAVVPADAKPGTQFMISVPVTAVAVPVQMDMSRVAVGGDPVSVAMNTIAGMTGFDIVQEFHALELFGIEKCNKYRIRHLPVEGQKLGEEMMFAKETSNFCERQMCGPQRSCDIEFLAGGATGPNLATWSKEFHVQGCICFRPKASIVMSTGEAVGIINDPFHLCELNQKLTDPNGNKLFRVSGPCIQVGACIPCVDFHFSIYDANDNEIGAITKKFNGLDELCLRTNRFQVTFPQDLPVQHKVLLLGATFLIDFEYFEKKKD